MSEHVYEKMHKSRLRSVCEGAAARVNRHIAAHFGDRIPLYCVAEYPRSGGTWLSSMMADYLRCAKPGLSVLPSACRAVMHNHWRYHRKLKRTVYLVRDGRDVMTSLYFFSTRIYRLTVESDHGNRKSRSRLAGIFGPNAAGDSERDKMLRFLEAEFENPTVLRGLNWAEAIDMWHGPSGRPDILYLKYEELRSDPVGSLRRAVEHVSPIVADDRLLRRSVEHFSMETMTGRAPGEADDGAFIRKGITGDWRNYFDREIAKTFDRYAGEQLVTLGYETSRRWVDEVPERLPAD